MKPFDEEAEWLEEEWRTETFYWRRGIFWILALISVPIGILLGIANAEHRESDWLGLELVFSYFLYIGSGYVACFVFTAISALLREKNRGYGPLIALLLPKLLFWSWAIYALFSLIWGKR